MSNYFKSLSIRIFLPISAIIVGGGIFAAIVIFIASNYLVYNSLAQQSLKFSQGTMEAIDPDAYMEILRLLESGPQDKDIQRQVMDLKAYQDVRHQLDNIRLSNKLHSIATISRDANNNYYYVVDGHIPRRITDVSFHIPGELDVTLRKNQYVVNAFKKAEEQNSGFISNSQGSAFITTVVPILGKNKNLLGILKVDYDVDAISTRVHQIFNVQIALLIAFVLLSVVTVFFIIYRMTYILRDLGYLVEGIKEGNLTQRVEVGSDDDELSDFARTLDSMTVQLSNIVRSIKLAGENSAEVAERIEHASSVTRNMAENIALTMTRMAVVSDDMQETSMEAVKVIDGMNKNFDKINESTRVIQTEAESTSDRADSGVHILKNAIMQLESIQESVEFTSVAIRELDGKSREIVGIIGVINDLADQTNLLALNASIEAARAGEHGKGFAIVADEVNELAEQSSNSTTKISAVVQEIQTSTRQASSSMGTVVDEVLAGTKFMKQAGEAFDTIVKSSSLLSDKISDLSNTTNQMLASMSNMSKTTRNMASEAKNNSNRLKSMETDAVKQIENMEVILGMAENLKNLTNVLMELVYHFKITPGQDIEFNLAYTEKLAATEDTGDEEKEIQSIVGDSENYSDEDDYDEDDVEDFFSADDLKEFQEEALQEEKKKLSLFSKKEKS